MTAHLAQTRTTSDGHSVTSWLALLAASTPVRFLAAGGISYLVNELALFLLYEHALAPRRVETPVGHLDAGLLVAPIVALEISILVRFALNDGWTFRDRRDEPFGRRLYESNLGSLAAPLIAIAAVNTLTPMLGVSYLLASSLGILFGLAWNWTWSSNVVWRERMQPAHATPAVIGRSE